jgi:hypothetical protein
MHTFMVVIRWEVDVIWHGCFLWLEMKDVRVTTHTYIHTYIYVLKSIHTYIHIFVRAKTYMT